MRSAGMGTATYQPTEGPDSRGVTSVTLFASAQGARQWLAQEQREDYIRRQMPEGGKLRRFVVPGIPGARGWSASKGCHIVGNIFWVQGRCMMILGHESTRPVRRPAGDRRARDLPAHQGPVPVIRLWAATVRDGAALSWDEAVAYELERARRSAS